MLSQAKQPSVLSHWGERFPVTHTPISLSRVKDSMIINKKIRLKVQIN